MDYFHNTHRWVLNNNTIEGFSGNAVGVALPQNAQVTVNGGIFNNAGTDILISPPSVPIDDGDEGEGFGIGMLSTNPTKSDILIEGAISFNNPNNNIILDPYIFYDEIGQKGFPLLDDAKSDSEFFLAPQEIHLNFGPFSNSRAYYNAQDADFIPIVSGSSGNACSFSDPSDCIDSEYMGQTNTQLFAEHENSYLGAITPSNAVSHPMIIGGKATNITTSTADLEVQSGCLTLYPNPTSDYFKIQGDFINYSIQILSSDGTLYQDISNQNSSIEIDLTPLPNGLYFVKVVNLQNSDICIQQIIKMN